MHNTNMRLSKAHSAKATKSIRDIGIQLPRVRLTTDDESGVEASLLRDELIELLHEIVVVVKDLKEGGLGAGRAFRDIAISPSSL